MTFTGLVDYLQPYRSLFYHIVLKKLIRNKKYNSHHYHRHETFSKTESTATCENMCMSLHIYNVIYISCT